MYIGAEFPLAAPDRCDAALDSSNCAFARVPALVASCGDAAVRARLVCMRSALSAPAFVRAHALILVHGDRPTSSAVAGAAGVGAEGGATIPICA